MLPLNCFLNLFFIYFGLCFEIRHLSQKSIGLHFSALYLTMRHQKCGLEALDVWVGLIDGGLHIGVIWLEHFVRQLCCHITVSFLLAQLNSRENVLQSPALSAGWLSAAVGNLWGRKLVDRVYQHFLCKLFNMVDLTPLLIYSC